MKKFTVEINVGDEIYVGRFRNVTTKIKAIEFDDHGQPVLVTSKGKKNLFRKNYWETVWETNYT